MEVREVHCATVSPSTTELCIGVIPAGAKADWRTPFSGVPHVSNVSFVDPSTQQGPTCFIGQREGTRAKMQIVLMGRAGGGSSVTPYAAAPQPPYYNASASTTGTIHVAGAEVFTESLVTGLNNLPLLDSRGMQLGTLRVKVDRIASAVPSAARLGDMAEQSLRSIETRVFGIQYANPSQQNNMLTMAGNNNHAGVVVDVTIFGPMGHKFSTRMMPNETFQVLREHLARHLGIAEDLQELAYVCGPSALNSQHMLSAHQTFNGSFSGGGQQYPVDWNMTAPAALMTAQSIGAHVGSPLRNRHPDEPQGLTLQLGCTDRSKFFIAVKLPSGDEKPLCIDSFTTVGALKIAVATLMSTPKQRARMAAIGIVGTPSRGRRLGGEDMVYPEQVRLMVNFQELQGDQTSVGTYGIVGGSVIIVSTNFSGSGAAGSRIRRAQTAGGGAARITVRLLGPDGGLGNVVQASREDEVAILRSVLVSTRKYYGIGQQYLDCYVDGKLVEDEGLSLAEAGCVHNSVVQFCYQGQYRGDRRREVARADRSELEGPSIVIDVEDAYGNIQQITAPRTAAVSTVRRYVQAMEANPSLSLNTRHERSFEEDTFVFLNGRLVHDEAQSIEVAVRNSTGGTHFEVRPPKNAASQQRVARVDVLREEARRKEVELLAQQMDVLQDQLNRTVTSSRDQERRLATHVQDAELQLQEERRRSIAARERVEELERAMDRQQDLLRRAAVATVPYQRNTMSLNPQVLQALARVNSPALKRY